MISEFILKMDKYIPVELSEGILYYSQEYGATVHLCPCGCGEQVRRAIRPGEWSITIRSGRATMVPSIYVRKCATRYIVDNNQFVTF